MSFIISEQTKAVLLLTSPLIVGKQQSFKSKILTPTEYNKLVVNLLKLNREPIDLLGNERNELLANLSNIIDSERMSELLERGLLMSQAIDQWQTRGIWIVSRSDKEYPVRLKSKLKEHAPPILYGCGNIDLLEQGGLAIVGSRNVNDVISKFVTDSAKLASNSGYCVISGGARGVDQIAMHAALDQEGTVIGVLAENLNRTVLSSHYRGALRSSSIVLVSAVDPSVGFNVGNAMARNKLIYALSDAGLIANADYEKGGTWAGAIEQIKRFNSCPIYVRFSERISKGNRALIKNGANKWPNPIDIKDFRKLMETPPEISKDLEEREFDFNGKSIVYEETNKSRNTRDKLMSPKNKGDSQNSMLFKSSPEVYKQQKLL